MAPRKGGKTWVSDATSDMNRSDRKPLPVTVLSGFLGSGKTTLLRHILHSADHGLKIAVIVNDMASLNVDGNLIARTIDSQRNKDNAEEVVVKERIVQMQNGCICCTLRGDLLTELARLAWSAEGGSFDHVVIESSGISEPQQVAETFTVELTEVMIDSEGMDTEERDTFIKVARLGGLKAIATIDTMVTVLDAFRFFAEFDTAEFLQDRFGRENVPEEDQRTISDLFADQIEFANVIVINKTDMVDKNTLGRVRAYVKTQNPTAKIIETKFCKVPVRELLNTGQFDFAEAVASPGWLRSLHEMTTMEVQGKQKMTPKPETLEYGIGSFVYRARKPFDPLKLYRAIEGKFILLQEELDDEEWEDESNASDSMSDSETNTNNASDSDRMSEDGDVADNMIDDATILANKKASPLFRGLHRSKGIFWLATRPYQMGSWSTAGAMLTLGSEMPWFCTVPEEEWMADEFTRKAITADFEGEWGDRRQEIVLIGEKLDVDGLTKLLNSCLLSSAEMRRWEKVMHEKNIEEEEKCEKLRQMWDDSLWAEWTSAEDDEEEHDHTHHGHNHRH